MRERFSTGVRRDAVPREEVLDALRSWAAEARRVCSDIVRIGCFGSYARNEHVPSSDLDLFVEVAASPRRRVIDRVLALSPPDAIPVGVDLFIYTSREIDGMRASGSRWLRTVESEGVWI